MAISITSQKIFLKNKLGSKNIILIVLSVFVLVKIPSWNSLQKLLWIVGNFQRGILWSKDVIII